MNADVFAEWLRRQGHRIERTHSSLWYEAAPGIYQAFPYHWIIQPSEDELSSIWQKRGMALRFSAPFSAARGRISYHVVCDDLRYSELSLSKKARYDVRQGLAYCEVKPISLELLASAGWSLRADTLARQSRRDAETEVWWQHLCLSARHLPGIEAWGASHNGELVAALLGVETDGCFSILYQQSLSAHLEYGVNNALAFVVTKEILSRGGIQMIFYGLHSLDAPSSVDEFKIRMGYRTQLVRQSVVFCPMLRPVVKTQLRNIVRWVGRNRVKPSMMKKLEGMIEFSLEGNRPLLEQDWPPLIKSLRSEVIE